MNMEDSINLQELFNNGKIELEDFTVYSLIDIFDEEVYKLEFDDYIARWINKSDIDIEPNNIINDDEYYADDSNKLIMTGAYCGNVTVKVSKYERDIEIKYKYCKFDIKSRFSPEINYEDMLGCIKKSHVAKDDWEISQDKRGNKNGLEEEYHYMPLLYEVFVREQVRKYLLENKNWSLVSIPDSKKEVCNGQTYCKCNESTGKGEFEIYLEGKVIPDIILKKEDGSEYVILDVKYKTGETNSGTRIDRFQILAYAYIWNCKRIGHIFPKKDSDVLEINNIKYIELKCNTESDDKFNCCLSNYLK